MKRFFLFLVMPIILLLIPVLVLAQAAVDPSAPLGMLQSWLESQSWFVIAATIIGGMKMITLWISDRWADKYPITKAINGVFNYLALNLFRDKNAGV